MTKNEKRCFITGFGSFWCYYCVPLRHNPNLLVEKFIIAWHWSYVPCFANKGTYSWATVMLLLPLAKAILVLFASPAALLDDDAVSGLMSRARQALNVDDTDTAFSLLAQAHTANPNKPGILEAFRGVFERRISLEDNAMDRMGLGSILLEMEDYAGAAPHLEQAIALDNSYQINAMPMLFQARAAVCDWKFIESDSQSLVDSLRDSLLANQLPAVHPYKALMWPCISLPDATAIASKYAERAISAVVTPPLAEKRQGASEIDGKSSNSDRIKVGYISPDFTGLHPLAFLMQDFFRFHNKKYFEIHLYSLAKFDESPEVTKIQQGADHWKELSTIPSEAAHAIQSDELDILVDLCGYTGTSIVAETLAHRCAPVQIGYMGFPASSGASFVDFMICDETVVPSSLRHFYTENLIWMPHSYFVNSHLHLPTLQSDHVPTRARYGLSTDAFVYCCHSRPEKIDPDSFRSWCKALLLVPNSVLWLLRSGTEMEENLRWIAEQEFGLVPDRLIFCDKAPREEHLARLSLADLFLDTPAYNAHTVGCDCLSAGVPMVSLLRTEPAKPGQVDTEKLASRVGASLLKAVSLNEMIVPSMEAYENVMVRCALDKTWFSSIKARLTTGREVHPLFDTLMWVNDLESALKTIATNQGIFNDIHVKSSRTS